VETATGRVDFQRRFPEGKIPDLGCIQKGGRAETHITLGEPQKSCHAETSTICACTPRRYDVE
jgi:hypothetical protein